ncbi:elongation factor P hydroxylase [Acinetobacter larvae]|uniref:Elongation factor P hydroxylase n=1 Tax=Acinetobacter larvae TaxID=1789224 RepID=A0A1B2LXE5_9GAMM|nr:elongation factor P hydroxylase [Acinetobacter larvae]AOA57443.1 hypothetical protein BFG52_03130 [Acinetobacter larvae]
MHLLQLQPEVTGSLLIQPQSTQEWALSLDQIQLTQWVDQHSEAQQVDWLILHFNHWFSYHNVILYRGIDEPEYFPATATEAAKIQFAHGFFNSALHEISHWTIAGPQRRLLPDLGYWYAPDGRDANQQALFEQVEIKPQAIEWLFATAFGRKFRVSLDNLNGQGSDGTQFKDNVYAQVQRFFTGIDRLPGDAQRFLYAIVHCTRGGKKLQAEEFLRENLN